MKPSPQAFVEAAKRYLGVPFVHQGRSMHGVDCVGLVVCAAKDIGLHVEDRTDYPQDPNGELAAELERQAAKVDEFAEGDLLLFRFRGLPQHLAIATDVGIIHAYAPAEKVVEHRLDSAWERRIVSAYRFREFVKHTPPPGGGRVLGEPL